MESALILLWGLGLSVSVFLMIRILGYVGLCTMFPEGFRWYTWPVGILSIVFYTVMVLINPFLRRKK